MQKLFYPFQSLRYFEVEEINRTNPSQSLRYLKAERINRTNLLQ
ncbi:hypothetical protein [Aquibacillus kalidii]|nr:hypothetical protein [Aquibacillus kalidii]